MRKFMLIAGAAALAAAMPAFAADQERGRGGGRGKAEAASVQKGGGQGRAERRGGREDRARAPAARAQERRLDRQQRRVERAIQQERRLVRDVRREQRRAERPVRLEQPRPTREARVRERRDWRGWAERPTLRARLAEDIVLLDEDRGRRLAVGPLGCPPGLARQNAFCMPPGQLRKAQLIGQRLPLGGLGLVPERYRYRFADDDRFLYRYGADGTVYRVDRATGLVATVVPLMSTGLFPGEPLPLGYEVYNVPLAYRTFYPDGRDYLYRYDDGAIYRVDAESQLVEGIVAFLTGGVGGLGALGVGDPLPLGYDVYNVPLDYRDRYPYSDDVWYRYADGSVYRVDPTTRLIQQVISLIV